MLDRKHVERVLKINGVPIDAPEDEIRATLLSAHYHEHEVVAAIALLRQGEGAKSNDPQGPEKLFQSDQNLNPQDISRLLGIDVNVSSMVRARKLTIHQSSSGTLRQQVVLIVTACTFGILCFIAAMYLMEFGVFHPTAATIFYGG